MQIELQEISDHLHRFPPFDVLPKDTLDMIAQRIEVSYFRAGSVILEAGSQITDLHYVRSGAVEIYRRTGELYNRLVEGDIFGQAGLLRSNKVRFPAKALEDSLIYFIPSTCLPSCANAMTASPISSKPKATRGSSRQSKRRDAPAS